MSELNYNRIAEILGGIATRIDMPVFGGMSAAKNAAERFRSLHETHRRIHLSDAQLALIVRAFEDTRNGFEVDRVLIDPILSEKFHSRCRRYGLTASDALINKRLQEIRKSNIGNLSLKPTTKASGIHAEQYNYVAELAFSQLTFRPELSVDDVVTDPKIGNEFAQIAFAIDPNAPTMSVKWALISLRKARGFAVSKVKKILELHPRLIEDKFEIAGSLKAFNTNKIPEEEGVLSLHEDSQKDRYLYLASAKNLRASCLPFLGGKPFSAIANQFWEPNPSEISLGYVVIKRQRKGATAKDWYFRLIEAWKPIFNIPVHLRERKAA